jgi:hypothetical protein
VEVVLPVGERQPEVALVGGGVRVARAVLEQRCDLAAAAGGVAAHQVVRLVEAAEDPRDALGVHFGVRDGEAEGARPDAGLLAGIPGLSAGHHPMEQEQVEPAAIVLRDHGGERAGRGLALLALLHECVADLHHLARALGGREHGVDGLPLAEA